MSPGEDPGWAHKLFPGDVLGIQHKGQDSDTTGATLCKMHSPSGGFLLGTVR